MKIIKFIICLLFGLMFINAGLNKFLNYMPMEKPTPEQMELFAAFDKIFWLMPLVGTVEIVGGLLFIFPKTRALGAIVILPVMIGIVIHVFTMDKSPMGISIAGVLFLINLWMLIDNKEKYNALLK
ncbi:MauE/DoxX family redox-associated membrane protein [Chryseobacterium indoltheticum]|uniref:DoxX n=1 Tax=Chryseobacterium indoltheticum TaxID=254 RepID=A0A381F5Y2_9FLAO|nr:MauE/DoxX family redox-associated membrane protein [Chryseobacterium indoltheticum]AZA72340.1 DoxX family membrane protein [Chryseobacterium indoltheticum]SIR10842.1 DoxX-like family protein [Chryseobacterium indoltheticum]SUX41903.1 DoxX [Chryseobacterium indoltheticum]